jgi:hypothetical protein
MTEQEIRDIAKQAMREVMTVKNSEDRLSMLEDNVQKLGNALNELSERLSVKKEEPKAEGENAAFEGKETPEEEAAEKKEEKEGATLENAKPSQAMVAAFATALNVDFGAKTPSFASLAALAGIKETDAALRIAAVNTKFAELQAAAPKKDAAGNAVVTSEVF